jgi:hypothetical protein
MCGEKLRFSSDGLGGRWVGFVAILKGRPNPVVLLCLLLQYLIQSCARGGRRIVVNPESENVCVQHSKKAYVPKRFPIPTGANGNIGNTGPQFALPCMRLFCLGSASPIVAGVMAEVAGAGVWVAERHQLLEPDTLSGKHQVYTKLN